MDILIVGAGPTNTELIGYTDTADGIRATIRKTDNTEETVDVAYLCGCDGANSFVRRQCGLEFPGGTYAGTEMGALRAQAARFKIAART